MKFYIVIVVISLSDWTPNGEFLADTSHLLDQKPSEYKPPPEYKPAKKYFHSSISPVLIFGILWYMFSILVTDAANSHLQFLHQSFIDLFPTCKVLISIILF